MSLLSADLEHEETSPLLIPQAYRVIDKIEESTDVFTLHLVPIEVALPAFEPAQVSMLGAFGVGEATISISSALSTKDYHAYTIRRAGPISGALVDTQIGGVVTIRGPFGKPWPLAEVATRQLAIIGGGLGIAPLRTVIHQAIAESSRFDRIALVYGAKTPDSLIYRHDINAWQGSVAEVALIVDEGDAHWDGAVGVVPDLLGTDAGVSLDWRETTAFVCGPDVMMHFAALRLIDLGVPEHQIWLTLERNMQCGNGLCGHCQLGPMIICRDGPVVNYSDIRPFHSVQEL